MISAPCIFDYQNFSALLIIASFICVLYISINNYIQNVYLQMSCYLQSNILFYRSIFIILSSSIIIYSFTNIHFACFTLCAVLTNITNFIFGDKKVVASVHLHYV